MSATIVITILLTLRIMRLYHETDRDGYHVEDLLN